MALIRCNKETGTSLNPSFLNESVASNTNSVTCTYTATGNESDNFLFIGASMTVDSTSKYSMTISVDNVNVTADALQVLPTSSQIAGLAMAYILNRKLNANEVLSVTFNKGSGTSSGLWAAIDSI